MKVIILLALAFSGMLLGACFFDQYQLDPAGLICSSDPDDRYRESRAMSQPTPPASLAIGESFIVITDTHFMLGNHNPAALQAAMVPSDRFILVSGDVVQKGDPSYVADAKGYFGSLGLPCYLVPGNHDMYFSSSGGGWSAYKGFGLPSSFSFAVGGLRVIGLDSASGTLGGEQMAWLEAELAAKTEAHCLVFTHMNFFPVKGELMYFGFSSEGERDLLETLFFRHGVEYVVSGHTHRYDAYSLGGVQYLVDPSFDSDATLRFMRFTMQADGVHWTLIP